MKLLKKFLRPVDYPDNIIRQIRIRDIIANILAKTMMTEFKKNPPLISSIPFELRSMNSGTQSI